MSTFEGKKDTDSEEFSKLSDVYSILTQDAKTIIEDLEGGVTMWREAAAGAAASAGFIVILILTAFRFFPPTSLAGSAYVAGSGIVAAMMALISAIGFRKYFSLRKKYSSLFQKVKTL
jgi:uncharacterized BrkB/YihY/UPF0761 family membrane protein